ncbi:MULTISPECIES: hypothetical protein [Sediminibacillus]|nr:hypothetical protein [Sediminibacillus terrae]
MRTAKLIIGLHSLWQEFRQTPVQILLVESLCINWIKLLQLLMDTENPIK